MQNTKQDAHTTGLERRVTGKEREDMRTLRILSLLAIVLARVGAEKVVIHDIQKQQKVNQHSKVSPFLSATLSAKLTGIDCKFLCFARFHLIGPCRPGKLPRTVYAHSVLSMC